MSHDKASAPSGDDSFIILETVNLKAKYVTFPLRPTKLRAYLSPYFTCYGILLSVVVKA